MTAEEQTKDDLKGDQTTLITQSFEATILLPLSLTVLMLSDGFYLNVLREAVFWV